MIEDRLGAIVDVIIDVFCLCSERAKTALGLVRGVTDFFLKFSKIIYSR